VASERWAEVERIYHAALEREAGERAAFLGEACGGDDALEREVQSLLDYVPAAGAFLGRPALEDEVQGLLHEPAPPLGENDIDGYRILSLLGAGGMGEVYRAKDLTLGREVAIKVLRRSAVGGPGDLGRFEEEARLASVLNHPNIVTIYGVGQKGDLAYIAMELVRGRTLRERLSGNPLAVRVALDLAAQLADALSVAHAHGIVHRDLKPENLMVTPEGLLKVLDFGIAKHQGPRDSAAAPQQGVHTEDGRILGTVGYMSPEQAAGQRAVQASDQFSFGTILYEMVTGLRAWKRNTAAETLTAIIREDPPPIASAAPATPTALRWIIDRCLAKDPEERYASTRDLARDLARLRNHLDEVSGAGVPAEDTRRPVLRTRGGRAIVVAIACLALIGAGMLLAPRFRKSALPDWVQVAFRRGLVWSGSFTPDGQTIVYSAAWDGGPVSLFSTRLASTATRSLDLPPGKLLAISRSNELAFVRDAHFGRFFTQPGTLVRAGLEAGVPRDILEHVQAADWSPDGKQLAVAREVDGKVRLEYPIGKTLFETDRPISNVKFSRDGAWIAFCEGGWPDAVVEALRVSDGLRKVLSAGWFPSAVGLAWSADGSEIWFTPSKQVRDSSPPLMAVTLSGKLREVVRGPGQLRLFDIAPDGRVLLARLDAQPGVRGSPSGTGQDRELSATDDSLLSDLSDDGRQVLFRDRNVLFLRGTDGSPPLRIGEGYESAHLSPDGRSVLAVSSEAPRNPVLIPVGAGDVRRIETTECERVEWFPAGDRILCEIPDDSKGSMRLLVIEVASGKTTEVPIAKEGADFAGYGLVSPDGSFVAGPSRNGDILILPLAGGTPRRITAAMTGLDRGAAPAGWTADGQHLFVYRGGPVPNPVRLLDLSTGQTQPWRDLTLQDPAGVARIEPVRVAPDGRSWAFGYVRILSNLYVVEGLK